MSKATNTPTTSRRGLLAGSSVGAILAGMALPAVAAQPTVPHPDADLIAACNEYLRIKRAFEAYYTTLPGDMEDDDPAYAMLDPLTELTETIVSARAATPEGHMARARCMAFTFLPHSSACQDDPDGAREDRFRAAMIRDLSRAEWGAVA